MNDPVNGVVGHHDPVFLEETLIWLKQNGYKFISLNDLINMRDGKIPIQQKCVVFTLDDGYLDQAMIAAPIFKKYNCPVTIFLISGFLDGTVWPWDDQIHYMLTTTKRNSIEFKIGESEIFIDLKKSPTPIIVDNVRNMCKEIPEIELSQVLQDISIATCVEIPCKPPKEYQPMNWSQARALEKDGVTFGPHGVSHRILLQMDMDKVRDEIQNSWKRVVSELKNPVNTFCFPTGRYQVDYGNREINIVKETGFDVAISADYGYTPINRNNCNSYVIKRMPFPDNKTDFIQYCSGIERMKLILKL